MEKKMSDENVNEYAVKPEDFADPAPIGEIQSDAPATEVSDEEKEQLDNLENHAQAPLDNPELADLRTRVAKALYTAFVVGVGEPAPSWEKLEADPAKIPNVKGWYTAADSAIIQLGEK
jgi:hypothetical protein